MKVKFDEKTGLPQLSFEQQDIQDAREIEEMMLMPGWLRLTQYLEVAKESIIEAGMEGISKRTKKELSAEKWAVLKGFTECCKIPYRIVERVKQYKEMEEKQKEALLNDAGQDDE